MAVVVQCFHCNAVLDLDEGFRGGVCRCSRCGSLLQVPRGDKESGQGGPRKPRPAMPPPAGVAKSTNGTPIAGAASPDKTEASVEDSVSSSSLRRIHQTKPVAPAERRDKSLRDDKTKLMPRESKGSVKPQDTNGGTLNRAAPLANAPALKELRRNNVMLWTAFLLIALIAVVVIVSMLMYLYNGDTGSRRREREVTPVTQPTASTDQAGRNLQP